MATEMKGIKIYMSAAEAERLQEIADEEDRSMASLGRRALREWLADRDAKAAAA